uniref:Uncharacterized protein n=1 Tax=Anguilla anguilla TaxID=7936 RepID=A0A0E9V7Q5_ANGAN
MISVESSLSGRRIGTGSEDKNYADAKIKKIKQNGTEKRIL